MITIIVCTQNRAYALNDCLDSIALAVETAKPAEVELVVVNNASTDNTAETVELWAKGKSFPVSVVYEAKKGLSRARNCGIRAAKGDLIAFTDDDCRMDKDYIVNLLALDAKDSKPVLRGGRVELGDPTDQPFCIKTSTTPQTWHKDQVPSVISNLSTAFIGANMTFRKSLVAIVGDFDERFGAGATFKGGEEIDYIYRAYLAGISIEYSPDLIIYHYHGRKTVESAYKLVSGYDLGDGALYAKFATRDINLLRPLWWDVKKAIKEFSGGALARPELGISHMQRVINVLRGMFGYYAYCIRHGFK